MRTTPRVLALSGAIALYSSIALAQEFYSPDVGQDYPRTVYWGDTHLHTSLSSGDAYLYGTRLGPEEAYRFARGEAVTTSNGLVARLYRPLDFLVIADHAESLGLLARFEEIAPALRHNDAHKLSLLKRIKQEIEKLEPDEAHMSDDGADLSLIARLYKEGALAGDQATQRTVWERVTAAADAYNDPGKFTAFIGYEWSSSPRASDGALGNLHRVVIFKDDARRANRVAPFSSYDSKNPEDLWAYLDNYEKKTGGEVLAIPHNGNTSNGEMFPLQRMNSHPLSRDYVELRQRWEPLYEVTQTKGTSEAHPVLSPNDEFADYEIWNSWSGRLLPMGREWNKDETVRKQSEYARAALQLGLSLHAQLGANPFKYGLIGGTDAHNALSAVDENNFWGKFPSNTPGTARLGDEMGIFTARQTEQAFWHSLDPSASVQWPRARDISSSGRAAVWATENTREALFAAMKRREVYATTGPRMIVRFFGGWSYTPQDALSPDLAQIAYRKGVPMGGDLSQAPTGRAPTFLIHATRDPDGANLDRLQVIKGWRNAQGDLHERVYDVALSDGRKAGRNGKVPPVGNTVDVKAATYTNTIGDAELAVVWRDPDFDSRELAFYYVRVLEIPTPRWTTYDAAFFKVSPPSDVPATIQERAYTSPIWYTPGME